MTIKWFAQQQLDQLMKKEGKTEILASDLLTQPLFIVDCHYCHIIDTNGMEYTVIGDTPNFEQSVNQWWPKLKLFKEKFCPEFESLRDLLSRIKCQPEIKWYDNGIRDGIGYSFYGVFGEDTWHLGSDSSWNIDPNAHAFILKVCEALKMEEVLYLRDIKDRHHPILCCDQGKHPLVELTQNQLSHREPKYINGYVCDDCHQLETTSSVLHCRRCYFDLCPQCVTVRLNKFKT